MARKPTPTSLSFEDSLKQLEGIVSSLEQGNLPLEEALLQFEQGMKLAEGCQEQLSYAESRIKLVTEQQGKPTAAPFESS